MTTPRNTRLWLVRHGATDWSTTGRHTSVTDLELLPEGREQATMLGPKLADTRFGLVLASPRLRARETAECAGFPAPDIDPDLVEWAYGPAEGLTSAEIRARVPGWRIWTHGAPRFDRDGDFAPGETVEQAAARLGRIVERVRASGVDDALVFGHGHALRTLAMVWLGLPVGLAAHFPLATGTISVLGYEKDSPAIVTWNSGAV